MTKTRRFLIRAASALLIVAVLLTALGAYYFKAYLPGKVAPQSFPQIEGEVRIAGLDGPVDIYRDSMGIPHIYATTLHDLFVAQGYVHAQDRFWQMDFWRHIGSGRLAEMFGESQVETDAFLRTLGWRVITEQEWEGLSDESQAILTAYAEGVNAYIAERDGTELSLEYAILKLLNPDYTIEPWTPIHSLTWAKAMAWDLRGNMGQEIERAVLLKSFTPQQVDELFPPYPQDHPLIVPQISVGGLESSKASAVQSANLPLDALVAVQNNVALLDSILGSTGSEIGSNSWAVSGELTDSGMPLLANDPHLGIQMPSIWYQIGLHCQPKSAACPFEVAGFSFAGVPGVIIGHNDRIAWGMTNVDPDVIDLYIEKVNPENPNQYEVNGQWLDFETRRETIQVGGGEAVEITVRLTRHGPVISDTYGLLKDDVEPPATPFKERAGIELPENYVVALRWTALEPSYVFEAIWGFNKAQNWDEFRQAARSFAVPAQNLLYADVDGNIGYQMPGAIPVRASGDGRQPVPGWIDDFEWVGYVPFEELPYALNPESGYIVTANNQVHPWDYQYLVTTDWDYGFRARRIVDMIESAPGPIDITYIQQMQADSYNMNAETLVPLLLATELDPKLASVRDQILGPWDFQNRADSAPAALFEAFWWNLLLDTFADDLPEEYWPAGGSRWIEIMRHLVEQPDSPWWDDKATADTVERRDEIFARAFRAAVNCQVCIDKFGKDVRDWKWGELHSATFRNGTLGESGIGPIEALFNRGPFTTGGGESIVNATGWTVGESFEVDWLPSMRMIVNLGNLNNSVTVHTTGQSGHAYSKHYDDMAPLWATMQYYPLWWEQESVVNDSEGHLRLAP